MKNEREVPEIFGDQEVEMQPLNTGLSRGGQPRPLQSKKITWIHSRWTSLILFIAFCLGISMIFLKLDSVQTILRDAFPTEPKSPYASTLEARLAMGKAKLRTMLLEHYGEYTDLVFDRETIMNTFHTPSGKSRTRLKRRMKIKLLQALLAPPNTTVNFIWATTGHSAAAGHGDLFNQTYSASIEAAARVVFELFGIHFYAKNYAMGGTRSGPEIAMCLPEIIGKDVDILSWDFGMTDGGGSHLYALFAQRAGVMKSRPIIFDFEGFESHSDYNRFLDDNSSMSVFTIGLIGRAMLPSSDDEKVNVDNLPSGVKNYICGRGFPEIGDCEGHKWDVKACTDIGKYVGFQVGWHNGWKDHLFIGRSIAAFLVEMLSDSIAELSEPPEEVGEPIPSLTRDYLNYLLQQEARDRDAFFESPVPAIIMTWLNNSYSSLFPRSNTAACHTARLPADSRFQGLVLESHVSTSYLYGGRTTYNMTSEGYPHGREPEPQPDQEIHPVLSYDYRADCPFTDIDTKDFFYVRPSDGWKKMIVPNPSEEAYYSSIKDSSQRHGYVMICDKTFDWGNAPPHYVSVSQLGNSTYIGDVSITINGIKVAGATHTDGCFVMFHEAGYNFENSTNNSYEIRLRVNKEGVGMMISSVIVL